jgi:hypothetical protein
VSDWGIKSLAQLIPDFPYDLTTRIPAGIVLITGVSWVVISRGLGSTLTKAPEGLQTLSLGSLSILLPLLVFLSYVAGMLVAAVSSIPAVWLQENIIWPRGNGGPKVRVAELDEIFWKLNKMSKEDSKIPTKYRAETALGINVATAALICLIVGAFYRFISGDQISSLYFGLMALCFILGLLAFFPRSASYYRATIKHWEISEQKEKKGKKGQIRPGDVSRKVKS